MSARTAWPTLLVALALADLLHRVLITTPPWLMHQVAPAGPATAADLIVLGLLITLRSRGAAIALTGVLCNVVDGLDGDVANPILLPVNGGVLATNVADFAILAGAIIMAVELGLYVRRRLRDS